MPTLVRKYISRPTLKPPGRFLPWGISSTSLTKDKLLH